MASTNNRLTFLEGLIDQDLKNSDLIKHLSGHSFFQCDEATHVDQHSILIDQLLMSNVFSIELDLIEKGQNACRGEGDVNSWGKALHDGHQTWVGLHPSALQTSFHDFAKILDILSPENNETIVDLGAAYGRLGFVGHFLYPKVNILGLEYVSERVAEGNRIYEEYGKIKNQLIQQDITLSDFKLPDADIYFIYDYGRTDLIKQTLRQLSRLADRRGITVVARGEASQHYIFSDHPWLSQIYLPRLEERFTIFSSYRSYL